MQLAELGSDITSIILSAAAELEPGKWVVLNAPSKGVRISGDAGGIGRTKLIIAKDEDTVGRAN